MDGTLQETPMTPEAEEAERRRVDAVEAGMKRDGIPVEESVQDDYFGFEESHKAYLPDGKSFIEHKTLNHGARKSYLNKTNRDLKINRASGDASISMKPGDEKDELLKAAVTGWNLVRAGEPVPFTKHAFDQWLQNADPRLVDIVEKDIRKKNPWLLAEMSIEDIDKEIESLQAMREVKLKEEEGKVS